LDIQSPFIQYVHDAEEFHMSLDFPNRLAWVVIAIVIFFLMQGGCKPIQPETTDQPGTSTLTEDARRALLSTNISNTVTFSDGIWSATTTFQVPRAADEYYQGLVVTHESGSPRYTLVDGWFPMGLGYTVATPFMWSPSGKSFYFTEVANPDGCSILGNGTDLYRTDLGTGATTEILAPNSTMNLALSPDEQQLAYVTTGKPSLVIREVESGEEVTTDLVPVVGDDQAGALVWSPDNNAVAFAIGHDPCTNGEWAAATSIVLVDALDKDNLTFTPLLEEDDRLLIPTAWHEGETLILKDNDDNDFALNFSTGEIEPIQ